MNFPVCVYDVEMVSSRICDALTAGADVTCMWALQFPLRQQPYSLLQLVSEPIGRSRKICKGCLPRRLQKQLQCSTVISEIAL